MSQAFGSSTGKQGPPACSNQSCPTTTGLTNLNRWGQYITTGVEDQNGIVGDEFYVLGTNLDSVTSVFMGAYPLTYPDWYDLNGSYLAIIIPGWIPVGNYSVEVENSYGYSPASQKMKITVGPPEFSVAFDLSNIPWSTGPATDNAEIQGDGFMNNISGENAVLGVKFGHYTLTPGNGTNPGTYDVVNGNAIFFTPPAGVPDGTYTMAVDTYQGLAQGVTMTYEITG